MRIVWAGTFLPFPPADGGRLISFHQLEGLARRGHRLTIVAPLRRPEDRGHVRRLERFAEVIPVEARARSRPATVLGAIASGQSLRVRRHLLPETGAALARALASDPDLVFVDSLFTAHVLPAVRRARPSVPVVLLEHNCESQLFERLVRRKGPAWRLVARWERPRIEAAERAALAGADLVLALSEEDARTLRTLAPDATVAVCGPGIPTYPGEAIPAPPGRATVLFLGTYRYPPNVDAATWLARAVWPRVRSRVPAARLVLAGIDPRGAVRAVADPERGIEAAGFVDDAATTTRDADVVVAPLRAGSGVRLKILEALANERPLVSTTLGAEGLAIEAGVHLLIADDDASFADGVVRLLDDREEAARLATAGRARVEELYSWSAAIERLESILLGSARTPGGPRVAS